MALAIKTGATNEIAFSVAIRRHTAEQSGLGFKKGRHDALVERVMREELMAQLSHVATIAS